MTRKLLYLCMVLLIPLVVGCGITSEDLFPMATSTPPRLSPTLSPLSQNSRDSTSIPAPTINLNQTILDGSLIDLYRQVSPGVVTIWSYESPADSSTLTLPLGQGSGFVIDLEGHIITNQHVVEDAAEIEVDFPSGLKAWAEIIGTDPDSDLAVLQVNVPEEYLVPLSIGDSDLLQVGDYVVAIGNPFGLEGSMTVGIVSALARTLDSRRISPSGLPFTAGDLIQTDAAINPGNSGGPLLNLRGEVVGVNLAIQTESFTISGSAANSGVGFAVPVNIVRRVAPQIIEFGEYQYPYLGISSLDDNVWNLRTLEALNYPPDLVGAYITSVVPESPADLAGLRGGSQETSIPGIESGGDLIIAIDGQQIRHFSALLSYLLKNTSVGQEVILTVLRGTEEVEIPLTIGARP